MDVPPAVVRELRGIAEEFYDVVVVLNVLFSAVEALGGHTRREMAGELQRRLDRLGRTSATLESMILILNRQHGDQAPRPSWFKGVVDGGGSDDGSGDER